MDKKRIIWLSTLGALCLVLIILFILMIQGEKPKSGQVSDFQPEDQSAEPMEMIAVSLFFISEEDDLLHPEKRDIPAYASVAQKARRTIEELIKGPESDLINPIPSETKLRELYITGQGDAFVDFSREIRENHPFGTSADIATVYAIVHSLTENFEEIKRVYILIDGGERETLGGHIDLRRPFLPRSDLIAPPR